MDAPTLTQWVTPIVCVIFASSFGILGCKRPELRSARVFALSYVFAAVATASEIYFPQSGTWTTGRLVGELCYIGCTVSLMAAATLEWRGRVWKLPLILGALGGVGPIFFYWFVDVDLVSRVIVNSGVSATLLAMASGVIWRHATHRLEQALAAQHLALGVAILSNAVTLGMTDGLNETVYGSSAYLNVLSLICAVGSLAIGVTLLICYGIKLQALTQELADRDCLTGLLNRRAFERAAVEFDGPFALVVVDLDHFKRINDTFGHQMGDVVIRRGADVLRSFAPPEALMGRLGGEEFCVVLPGCDPRAARLFADDARVALAAQVFDVAGLVVTGSFGWVMGTHYTEAFGRADAMLYQAKNAGRDRVIGDDGQSHLRAVA